MNDDGDRAANLQARLDTWACMTGGVRVAVAARKFVVGVGVFDEFDLVDLGTGFASR